AGGGHRAVDRSDRNQSSRDLLLIFVGANAVATTFQGGASLAASFPPSTMLALVAIGSVVAVVAALAPIGSRLRAPSVIEAACAVLPGRDSSQSCSTSRTSRGSR